MTSNPSGKKNPNKLKACFLSGSCENGLDGETEKQPFHSRRAQMSSFSMETQKSVRVFLGKDLGGWGGGGVVWVG